MIDFLEEVKKRTEEIPFKEQVLGKSLYQPYTDVNSGVRKIMAATQLEHHMPLIQGEVATTVTGYENRYGDESSAIIKADADLDVIAKISKFEDQPQHHYYILLYDKKKDQIRVQERKPYKYIQQTYGYMYDNHVLDSLDIGYVVPEGQILRTSQSVDEYMNREDGVNLNAVCMACEITKEDGMKISESARKKLGTRLFRKVTILFNNNDIFLNTMGDRDHYKSFPMIGEKVKDGVLCAVRREQSNTALYTQSVDQLMRVMMSDDLYTTVENGTVIDIDIKCNNPDILRDKHTSVEVLYYYNNWVRFMREFCAAVESAQSAYTTASLSYELETMYVNFKRELAGVQFINNKSNSSKVPDGTYIEFMVVQENYPNVGDKITNRFGGKGVISKIVPDEDMPMTADTGEHVDLIMNAFSFVNRENPGAPHELSLTHISRTIVDFIRMNVMSTAEAMQMIIVFLGYVSASMAAAQADYFNSLSDEEKDMYLQSIIDDGVIYMSNKPMTESMTQDRIKEIYDEFNFVHQRQMIITVTDSRGMKRKMVARRPVVFGKMYMYRLKQYAEEKFTVTNLSSTNLRGENCRNKASKNGRALHPSTPVQIGYMECDDLGHMGFEPVVEMLMIHSVSPQGRQLASKLYTEDPYDVNVELDSTSKNRSAEEVHAYLKAIGYRFKFTKRRKKKIPMFSRPMFTIAKKSPTVMINRISDNENFDIDKWVKDSLAAKDNRSKRPFEISPFKIDE